MLLFTAFFLLMAFWYTTKSVRQSTFIESLGAAMLPVAYLLVAVCSYPLLRLYSRLADRMPRTRLVVVTSLVIALSMGLFWWLYQFPWSWVPIAFYVWVSLVIVMMVSQFWSFSNLVLDARQAKRLFGFVGAGGLLGGIAGGQVARFATRLVGTRYALIVGTVLLLAFVAILVVVGRIRPSTEPETGGSSGMGKLDRAKGGFDALRESRHLRLIAALMLLTIMVAQVVDLQFNWAVEEATTNLDQATAFFGNFFSVMGISALIFQLLFTARIHRFLGVGVAMRILPVTMGVGTAALLLAALFPGPLVVAAALILKIGENGLRYSLDQATRELLYLPVPAGVRVKAKAFIDVFVQRGAKGLAAVLLLPVTFGVISALESGWISFVLIALWLGVTAALGREYVKSFRRSLLERSVDAEVPINLSDATTLELLIQSLGSSDTRQVLHALEILETHDRGHLVPPLLLYHDDARVRERTLEILASVERRDAADLVEGRLSDEDPEVRARAIDVLARLQGEDASGLMLTRIHDPDPAVRAAAVACLANHGTEEMTEEASGVLADMLSDADARVRVEAAKALGTVREPGFQEQLVQLLYDDAPDVVRGAISAIRRRAERDSFNPLYSPSLVSLLQKRRLKQEAREALVALGEPVLPALVHFLNDPDEQRWVRRAIPKTLARIESGEVIPHLVEALPAEEDAFLRRKLLEALAGLPPERRTAVPREAVEAEIHRESRRYFEHFGFFCSLGSIERARVVHGLVSWEDDDPPLLDRLLAERMEESVSNLFELLTLRHPAPDIRAAQRTLMADSGALRVHSLEYLDNTLEGDVKRDTFLVIGDTPLPEKMRRAGSLFGVETTSEGQALERVLAFGGDGDRAALVVGALYTVRSEGIGELLPRARALAEESPSPFVRETAAWVIERIESSRRASS
ncbi:MAG: Npt1/Npt2 family nucleotide transporter [Thermoanaerobaculia bacterium]|nr:Npt1/Npt2 family nucleotide transporter [Thermoanaerobaculia bacterium]